MAEDKKNLNNYSAENIQVLEGLDPVRKRPGMYIGSTDVNGLHHLVTEIVNNSMDEAIAGFANHIKTEFLKDGSVVVYDNGRGIPYEIKEGYGVSALELAYTKLHAGGKFGAGGGYQVASGLHGVGASVVNALSFWCRVIVKRGDEIIMQEFENGGKPLGKVLPLDINNPKSQIKDAEWNIDFSSWPYESGTIVQFKPDTTIFETGDFRSRYFVNAFREYAFLTAGIKFELIDHRESIHYAYYFEGGIKSYLKALTRNKDSLQPLPFHVRKEFDEVDVEVAFQYTDSFASNELCFANHLKTAEGGTHLTGFRSALTRTINDYARNKALLKDKEQNFSGDDLREGLTAIISVKLESDKLQFEGQTKGKLGNSHVRPAVETVVKDALEAFLEENPKIAQAIIDKNSLAQKARLAAKAARDTVVRKTALEGGGMLPGKLAECTEKNPDRTELFIVEGDSAGGCFDGNTRVALTDGRNLSFIDLVDEQKKDIQNYGYTMQANGHIGVAPLINIRKTKRNAEVIKVVLDNEDEILCTPDHKFRLTDGTYIEAKCLTSEHNLAPLYRKISSKSEKKRNLEGYEMLFDPQNKKWNYAHVISDMYNLKNKIYEASNGKYRHHVDFNKLNNNPDNIQRLSLEEHNKVHYENLETTLMRPGVQEKATKTRRTKAFREKARQKSLTNRELFSKNAKKQWENPEYKKYMTLKYKEYYESNEEYRQKNANILNKAQKKYWSVAENRKTQAKRVTEYFKYNPEAKKHLVLKATNQWKSQELREWRAKETSKQWTNEFREKRKRSYNQTYLNKALKVLKKVYETHSELNVDAYNQERNILQDKSVIRMDTICNRFFDGDLKKLEEAVTNYNHKVVRIQKIQKRVDVYDLEVPETHNFALAAGIFVHNSAKQGRDRQFQAILPLFGKVLNTERARLDKVVDSDKFKDLIIAVGAGIGESYNPKKLRYNKLIIMTDADIDGQHILTLYLTFFYRHLTEVVDNGHLYVAVPPLYKATWGKNKKYILNEDDLDKFKKTSDGQKAVIQRFKGLGEMNAEELWETTMNPETRYMKQITVDDASKADEVFTTLMGSEVAPRKRFIQTHAKEANIDIAG